MNALVSKCSDSNPCDELDLLYQIINSEKDSLKRGRKLSELQFEWIIGTFLHYCQCMVEQFKTDSAKFCYTCNSSR